MKDRLGRFKLNSIEESLRIKNLVPGTLVYQGDTYQFDIDVLTYDSESFQDYNFKSTKSFIESYETIKKDHGVNWINVKGLNHVAEIEALGNYFGMNNLLLEQVLNITKYTSYYYEDSGVFGDLQMIYLENQVMKNENISLFVQDNSVLTFNEMPTDILTPLIERIREDMGMVREQNSYYLFYSILDVIVDNYLDVMNYIKYDVMQLEERVVNEESLDIRWIHNNRKKLLHFKLAIGAFEKMIDRMQSDQRFNFTMKKEAHLNNLSSHLREVSNELVLQQETVNVLYENYMLNNSNEMNSIMTTLTLFSAIFIPLSFLTGIFGMNFRYIPGLESGDAFYIFVIGCVALVTGMLSFFKIKKWF